jgi:hypothetical protein
MRLILKDPLKNELIPHSSEAVGGLGINYNA